MVLFLPVMLFALPEGESVVSGEASFDRSASNTLNINTPSDKLIVNYNSFNIAAQEAVRFLQPSASSVALNRVVGIDPSSIMGTLSANGQIFLVNPNGVLFGPGSHVDVAGLVASTLNIANEDFLNGNYVFSQEGKGSFIINQGSLNAQSGGYVCLLSQAVDNRMMIQADLGTVVLASGEKMTLALEDKNAISVVIDEGVQEEIFGPDGQKISCAVKNSGSILAEGGKVILTAKILNRVFDYAINNTGLVKVTSLVKHDGIIELLAEGAQVANSGTLEADKVSITSDAAFTNSGEIKAQEIYIKVKEDSITNTKEGKIIAYAPAITPAGGKIVLEAESILQQGLISANADEEGTAGEISIISENNTVLDENSSTEARAMGLVGNGGRISIDARQGSVFVNKTAKIDFSAGALSGNGGTVYIDAFQQLGFFGILNGRAPPGFTLGKAILDPEYATIGDPAGSTFIEADATIDAWRDITIIGNITLGYNATLNLFADQQAYTEDNEYFWYEWDSTYDPGIGSIINTGDYTISGDDWGGTLNLRAGSGIGSLDHPVLTNVGSLSAVINPESTYGDIFIEQGAPDLYVSDIRSPGLVVLMASGSILNGAEGTAIEADELYLEAIGGIGDPDYELEISVNNLVAFNEENGGIYLRNDKDLVVLTAENTAAEASINISAEGDLRVRYGIWAEGDIELNAQGNLYINTIANITAPDWAGIYLTSETGAIARRNMEVLDYGLQAYWNFDEGYGNYVYDQVTGMYSYVNGNPGWGTGVDGSSCLYFDGVDDYINTGRNFNFGSAPFTLIVWYQGTQNEQYVGLAGATPGRGLGYALENHNGYLRYWLNEQTFDSTVAINNESWYQLSMVRDGNEGGLYVFDGDETRYFSEFTVAEGSADTSSSFCIGSWGYLPLTVEGYMDDVRAYNQALSGLEIFAQTQMPAGRGEISAGTVELSAVNGIDVAMNGVQTVTASNSGSGDINIINRGDLQVGYADSYEDGIYNHGGDIYLQAMSSLNILGDIYADAPGGSISLYADDNIELADQVSISSNVGSDYYNPVANAVSGDVILSAGGDIIFGRGAGVYSYANGSGSENCSATSGVVSLTAGNNITMDWGHVYSQASASGSLTSTAYSGDVLLEAGNNLTDTGFLELIYSSANANSYLGTSAYAQSGLVSLNAGNTLTIDGRDPYYNYGADVYSWAQATAGYSAEAYSSAVILAAAYGDILLTQTEVRSDADAQTSLEEQAGSSMTAIAGQSYYDYNNYEWGYQAVLIDAGNRVVMADNSQVYGSAVAQGSAEEAYARAGDVTLDAWYDITLASHVYSDALTSAVDLAESVSGKVNLVSYYGTITIPVTSLVWSNVSAVVNSNGGSAYATSDSIDVHSWYGAVNVYLSAYSTAEAYAGGYGDYTPGLVQATSGDVTMYAGTDLTLDGGYAYTGASSSSSNAVTARLTAGNVNLAGNNIYLIDGYVYSQVEATALNAYAASGGINIYSSGIFDFNNNIYSQAAAYGESYANAVSGPVTIESGSLTVNNDIYSLAEASSETDADAYSGLVDLTINGNFVLNESVYSSAEADSSDNVEAESGDVSVTAYGAFTGNGGYIYSQAGAPEATSNSMSLTAGDVTLYSSGNMDLIDTPVQSNATASAYEYAYARTGNIDVTCLGLFRLIGFPDLNSRAQAYAFEGDAQEALAYAGYVSVLGYNGIEAAGDPQYDATVSFTSWATAESSDTAWAQSDDVNLESLLGSITLSEGFISSLAEADTGEGNSASAYSGSVSLIAGDAISFNNVSPNSRADASNASNCTAGSGNIIITAENEIVFSNQTSAYTSAVADAYGLGDAQSGDVDVTSFDGWISFDGASFYSSAQADGYLSADADSGDVTLFAEYASLFIDGHVYSSATAESSGDAAARSGDAGILAWGILVANSGDDQSSVYSSANALSWGDGNVDAQSGVVVLDAGGDRGEGSGIQLTDESSVYSSATAQGGAIATSVSGDMGLFTNASIIFNSGHVYTQASAGTSTVGGDVPASNSAIATSGEIIVSAFGNFILDLVSGLNSTAYAYGVDTAVASSGPLEITTGANFSVLSESQVYSMAQAIGLGAVAPSLTATAQAGALSVYAIGDIEIDVEGLEFPVRSEAIAQNAEGTSEIFGDMILRAGADLTLNNNLMGNTIGLYADYDDDDVIGELIFEAEYLELVAFSHSFQGANDFVVTEGADGSFYLSLNDDGTTLELYAPYGESSPSSIAIYSTLEETLTVNELQPRDDYIYLHSAGDLYLNCDLEAGTIQLHADNNDNGAGNLYSAQAVNLTSEYFSFQSASNFTFAGENLLCGNSEEPDFSASLLSDDDGLNAIRVRSTAGSIFVQYPQSGQVYGNVEVLDAARDIFLNAAISGLSSGLYISAGGAIIAGAIEGPHITSSGDVYIYDGTYSRIGEYPDYQIVYSTSMIGSLDIPLDVLITGVGNLNLVSYGLIDGVSAAFTGIIRGETTPDVINVLSAPGIVYFNNIPSEQPEPEPEPEPEPVPEPESVSQAPVGSIISYEPVSLDASDLAMFQFNSPIGSVFFYHPLTESDMGAFDQFSVGADAYELTGGQLKLVGHDSLLQFFQDFDEKLKSK